MVEKIKADVSRLFLVTTIKKKISDIFCENWTSFNFDTKISISTSVFIFSTISQILKRKVYVLWTQTCRNLKSITFANFLSMYHMPLKKFYLNT